MLNNIRGQKNISLILMGGLFFIMFKFSIIDLLWSGRVSPPMPADSILYITGLKDYIQTGDTSTTLYLSFVLLFGNLAKLFTISALDVYEIQFYIGALFSLFSICFLMQRLEFSGKSILTACILLAVMRVMPGSNFWIVPNYWSVYLCLFFIALSFGRNQRLSLLFMISVPIIATFAAFFHRSFIFYSAGMFAVLLVLSVLFEGKGFNKRFLYSLVVTILSYMLVISSVDFLGAAKVTAYIPSASRSVISLDHFINSWGSTYNLTFYLLFSPVFALIIYFLFQLKNIKDIKDIDHLAIAAICCFIVFSFHYRTRGLLLLAPVLLIWFAFHLNLFKQKKIAWSLAIVFFSLNFLFLISHTLRLNAINDVEGWQQKVEIPSNASAVSVWPWMAPSIMKYSGHKDFRVNIWDQDVLKDKGVIVLLDPRSTYFSDFTNLYWGHMNDTFLLFDCRVCNRLLGLGYPHDSLRFTTEAMAIIKANKYNLDHQKIGDYGSVSVFQMYEKNDSN